MTSSKLHAALEGQFANLSVGFYTLEAMLSNGSFAPEDLRIALVSWRGYLTTAREYNRLLAALTPSSAEPSSSGESSDSPPSTEPRDSTGCCGGCCCPCEPHPCPSPQPPPSPRPLLVGLDSVASGLQSAQVSPDTCHTHPGNFSS